MANDINQTIDNISIFQSITNPEWIAITISIISAVFAYWSWKESKKANNINKHPMQLEIYDAFNSLKSNYEISGGTFHGTEASKGYEPLNYKAFQKTGFYFNENLAKQIEKYYKICMELTDLNRRYWRDQNNESKVKKIYKEQDILFKEAGILSEEIEEKFKKVLKL